MRRTGHLASHPLEEGHIHWNDSSNGYNIKKWLFILVKNSLEQKITNQEREKQLEKMKPNN